jgi:hypothetical protein
VVGKAQAYQRSKTSSQKVENYSKSSTSVDLVAITDAGGGDGDAQTASSAQQRPPGKKKEKQILRQRASMEAMEYLVAKNMK